MEYHNLILDSGALLCLLDLLKRHKTIPNAPSIAGFLRRVIEAIAKLAHTNNNVKILIRFLSSFFFSTFKDVYKILYCNLCACINFFIFRIEDGIPPLVELLEYKVRKVQLMAITALGALAYNNAENVSKVLEFIK